MNSVLWVLIVQGTLGAFDTIYFHEYRARLPKLQAGWKELILHAIRDFVYSIIFVTLPWTTWRGWWAAVLVLLLAVEIVITMYDFVIEDTTRRSLGGVYPGERVTHAIMGIAYGIFLARLFPILKAWFVAPTSVDFAVGQAGLLPKWIATAMGIGVLVSGVRDLVAALSPETAHDKRELLRAKSSR